METKIGAGSALEPRAQSTRAHTPLARGYKPPQGTGQAQAHAMRIRLHGESAPRYGASELYIAFVGGLVLAACVFVPFLPHFPY